MTALDMSIDSNYLNYSTGLLVSILLRYPEVGTISCSHEQQALVVKFLVTKECPFEALKSKLSQALEIFHKIEGRTMNICRIEHHEGELDVLVITRDLRSITQSEMNLIVEIVKCECGKQLITDESDLPEEEITFQEEVINHMLVAMHSKGTEKNITALREDGRVLVFNG